MEFNKKIVWYIIGITFGIFVVFSFFGMTNNMSCNYFPDARVKNNIKNKTINFDEKTSETLHLLKLDSIDIYNLLTNGDVVFAKSNVNLDSCNTYFIENKKLSVVFENCNSSVNILEVIRVK